MWIQHLPCGTCSSWAERPFEEYTVAPVIFQLEFIKKSGLHFSYGNQEKCGWGCFFQGHLWACKWSKMPGVASEWAGFGSGPHLGHMCCQQNRDRAMGTEPSPQWFLFPLSVFWQKLHIMMVELSFKAGSEYSNYNESTCNQVCWMRMLCTGIKCLTADLSVEFGVYRERIPTTTKHKH